ncbi:MAG: hypothetical protein QOI06_236 [Nocardioidaceae bacterium]|jgi:hypothetical protein|nr:hypothetical protein [Nocardioidaceae bacterium]
MTGRAPQTPRETALAAYHEAQNTVATWSGRAASHRQELLALESTAGTIALDNMSAAAAIPKKLQTLRDHAEMAAKASMAAEPRVAAARRAVLLAEADEWGVELVKRQTTLDKHRARTGELLGALLEHEGRFISLQEADLLVSSVPPDMVVGPSLLNGAPVLKSQALRAAVAEAKLKVAILRAYADGRPVRAVTPQGEVTETLGWGNRAFGPQDWPESMYDLGLVAGSVSLRDQAQANVDATRRIVDEAQAVVDRLTAEAEAAAAAGGPAGAMFDRQPLTDAERALELAISYRDNAARALGLTPAAA